ncbi:ABC transporter ATP-binding protein YtrB [compost metagenome]
MNPLLEVNELQKKYPSFLLDRISFHLPQGSITGFIGANGAGKTTTLHSILNIIDYDAGHIVFRGERLTKERNDLKKYIGYMGNYNKFYDNVKLKVIAQFVSEVYSDHWDPIYYRYLTNNLFELDTNKRVKELSRGMQAKFALTLALSHHPELLILDEPTSGLDPISRDALLDVLFELRQEKNTTILFSSHLTEDMEKIADTILFIDQGKLLLQASQEDLRNRFKRLEEKYIEAEHPILQKAVHSKGYVIFDVTEYPQMCTLPMENARADEILRYLKTNSSEAVPLFEAGRSDVIRN